MMSVRGKKAGNKGQGSNWITRKRRLAIYKRDGWGCVWCGHPVWRGLNNDATLDHVVPREHGGGNETHNLVTCCMSCNRNRGSKSAGVFARELAYRSVMQGTGHYMTELVATLERLIEAVTTPLAGATSKARTRARRTTGA